MLSKIQFVIESVMTLNMFFNKTRLIKLDKINSIDMKYK